MRFAQRRCRGPPKSRTDRSAAQRFIKANVRQADHLELPEALVAEGERMARSAMTDEHRQAVKRWMAQAEAKRAQRI